MYVVHTRGVVKSRLLRTYDPFNGRAVDKRYGKRLLLLLFFRPRPLTRSATEGVLLFDYERVRCTFRTRHVRTEHSAGHRRTSAVENPYDVSRRLQTKQLFTMFRNDGNNTPRSTTAVTLGTINSFYTRPPRIR